MWHVRYRAQRRIRRSRRSRRSVSLLAVFLLLPVGFLQAYTISKHILADFKFSRWIPRVIRELRRDLSVSWSQQLAKSKSMPLFELRTQLPVSVITLKTDESRLKILRRLLQTQAVVFKPFYAIDGGALAAFNDWQDFAGPRRRGMLRISGPGIDYKILHERLKFACFLTHVALWKRFVENFVPATIILEDDVTLGQQFIAKIDDAIRKLPSNWDIMYLGSTSPMFGGELHSGVWQLRGALGTFGYVISRAGAVKMLDFAVESDKPIDHLLDSAIAFGRILAFHVQPALVEHRSDMKTTLAYHDT